MAVVLSQVPGETNHGLLLSHLVLDSGVKKELQNERRQGFSTTFFLENSVIQLFTFVPNSTFLITLRSQGVPLT